MILLVSLRDRLCYATISSAAIEPDPLQNTISTLVAALSRSSQRGHGHHSSQLLLKLHCPRNALYVEPTTLGLLSLRGKGPSRLENPGPVTSRWAMQGSRMGGGSQRK